MNKEEMLKELRRTNENYPPAYKTLESVSKVMLYVAIVLFILGAISAIIMWKEIGFTSFLTSIISAGASAGVLYAVSAGLDGLATIVLNTTQSKNLLLFKIKQENNLNEVEHRKGNEIVGVSDKSLTDDNIYVHFENSVKNDTTGNWRLAKINQNIDISKYALSYYKKYFKNDNEIHAIINSSNKTTTNMSLMSGMLFVTTLEYIDKEEYDAHKLFSGRTLYSYTIYLDNGDIEKI